MRHLLTASRRFRFKIKGPLQSPLPVDAAKVAAERVQSCYYVRAAPILPVGKKNPKEVAVNIGSVP